MVRGFGCLELCIYGLKELASATQCKPQTSNGPVWPYRYILWEADSFGSPVTLPCLLVEEQSSQVIQTVKLLALLGHLLINVFFPLPHIYELQNSKKHLTFQKVEVIFSRSVSSYINIFLPLYLCHRDNIWSLGKREENIFSIQNYLL